MNSKGKTKTQEIVDIFTSGNWWIKEPLFTEQSKNSVQNIPCFYRTSCNSLPQRSVIGPQSEPIKWISHFLNRFLFGSFLRL